tara:strand:+ start:3116 stop:3403 length:288 start_codon:yes stop_codon:yes gene_type:complete
MDDFLKNKILKFLTPLGILSLIFFIWTIIEIIRIVISENDPGFGGVIIVILGIVFIVSFLLDRILTILLKSRTNFKVQFIIVLVFLISLFYLMII